MTVRPASCVDACRPQLDPEPTARWRLQVIDPDVMNLPADVLAGGYSELSERRIQDASSTPSPDAQKRTYLRFYFLPNSFTPENFRKLSGPILAVYARFSLIMRLCPQ